jgi:hypothetical protein
LSVSETLLLALLGGAFGWGAAWASLRGRVNHALRTARRAHERIDELENQTGKFTTLRS